jgi:polyhydroxybutyrate depolymerase
VAGAVALAIAACTAANGSSGRSSAPPEVDGSNGGAPTSSPATADADADPARSRPPPTSITVESIDVGASSRSYVLAKPNGYTAAQAYPLVLVLHGDGEDGAAIRAAIGFEYASRADAIVAYPTGRSGWDLYTPPDGNEDLAFLVALVDSLRSRFSIDPARVFGVGFSSGAFMVNQVACRRPTLFRAIVPHSGGAPSEPSDPAATRWGNDYTRCAGQTMGSGPAVMVIHGTADHEVTFDSGDFTASYWAFIDGCRDTRSRDVQPPPCVAQDGCPTGKPVDLCAIPGLAHGVWPDAASAAWGFFSGLP